MWDQSETAVDCTTVYVFTVWCRDAAPGSWPFIVRIRALPVRFLDIKSEEEGQKTRERETTEQDDQRMVFNLMTGARPQVTLLV